MLRDVFYYGKKPNIHPRERFATSIDDAREKSTTEHFWIINEFCDYKNFDWDFDFDFLPDEEVWTQNHNNIWPSMHQKDSGTWLCSKEPSTVLVYRSDVAALKRNIQTENWVFLDKIDKNKFDLSWHPDPTDPPYIYKWGCKYYPVEIKSVLEYHVPGASQIKYMNQIVELEPLWENWIEKQEVDKNKFDMSWRPNPMDPPFIYVWGNKWQSGKESSTLEYHTPGATEKKYMPEEVPVTVERSRWKIYTEIDETKFDLSWRPDPKEPPYIYVFGNNLFDAVKMPTLEYHCPEATEKKYMNYPVATLIPNKKLFEHLEDSYLIDYNWLPDPDSPPYIYAWGNQWNKPEDKISVKFVVDGATEYKYMEERAIRKPCMDNWITPDNIDIDSFDYSWEPSPADPPYIYEFGTQWQKTGGPCYVVPGATERKYVDTIKGKAVPSKNNWTIPDNVDVTGFDFSWHPDNTSPSYIYVFPTQWAMSGGPKYIVDGATEIKYVDEPVAKALPDKTNWEIPEFVDPDFDYSWHPYSEDEPFIYQFGTQWQKTGGHRYITPGVHKNSAIKYVDTRIIKSKRLPNMKRFATLGNVKIKDFDYSWHPDDTEEPYIYIFGNNQYPAEEMPTIEYNMPGAKQIKYVHDVIATLDVDMSNWEIPENVDITGFDFSWKPNPKDPPYIYEFGTQWQKTGGPRYVVGDATEIKYVTTQQVKKLSSNNNWVIPEGLSIDEFDFSWHPDATDIPYIYQFGTQWAITGGPRYVVEGAKEVKYIDNPVAISKGDKSRWIIPDDTDQDSFDFSWHPYVEDQPYIYQFGTQWQKTGGPRYIAEGADETSFTKYIDRRILQAKKLPVKNNLWHIPDNIDSASIDFSWHPDETEEPYIYHFGTQWNNRGGPEYRVPGATKYKYITDIVAKTLPNKNNWNILIPIDESSFDFSWVPHPDDPPYIYVFGNQWNRAELEPTVQYEVPGAKEIKYIHDIKAKVLPNITGWTNIEDVELFDYSWRPDPTEPAYICVFGNKQYPGNIMPTVRFTKPGATQIKYIDTIVATLKQKPELFENTRLVSSFDYSWRPNPKDPPYIYQFGTQWQKTGGPRYVVKGATEIKYIEENKAIVLPDRTNWVIPEGVNVDKFDFSWHPDDTSPKYIYQFGTIIDPNDGPRYIVPGNDGHIINMERVETENSINVDFPRYYIKTTLEDLINEHPSETFWALNTDIDYLNFDFSWRPSIDQANYIHVFGSPDSELTQTYFVNASLYLKGNTQLRFVEDAKLNEEYLTKLFKKPDMFFVDRGNKEVDSRFEQLKIRFPDIQKTRYLNSWVDTINRCTNRATSKLCWILNSELDYTNFNFDYYPNPWQIKMVHVFGTQWSHWGTTFMINRETFREDTKYIKIIEHLSNLNFVKNKIAVATNRLYDVYIIDHGNKFDDSLISHLNATKVPYQNSYFETFKNIVSKLPEKKDHYIWICSSVCDYHDFDFTYICDPFAREQLHVFPSDKQKMGDTFLVNVNKLRELLDKMEKLEDYEKINYNSHLRVKRLPEPRIITLEDTHSSIADIDFDFPYATFVTEDNQDQESPPVEPMSLWSEEHKKIIVTSTGGTQLVVPKEIRNHVKNELYDYPYIVTNNKLSTSTPLDIVFLSNGEKCADENYEYLLRTIEGTKNRVVRVDGVNGRVKAYHAALEASNTSWAFTVFAKLKVNNKFDWNWQPDRLQKSKHYIFTAKNPLNGLVYGHQAIIAYNKKLVLANQGKGLDFTLDDLHESVNMLSGTAMFNTDEFSTWRTAFREVIKLKSDYADISQERLEVWLNKADGDFAQYCLDGARHAVEYYDEVEGDIEKLRLSYDWPWLKAYFDEKFKR